jgi:Ran GTPase-activating protein (RanGAP) involved in mRNA processing and transport
MYDLCSRIQHNDTTLAVVSLQNNQEFIHLTCLAHALAQNCHIRALDLTNSIPSLHHDGVNTRDPSSSPSSGCCCCNASVQFKITKKLLSSSSSSCSCPSCDFATLCRDGLRVHPSLTCLNLSDNVLGVQGARFLRQGLHNHPTLEQLILHKCHLGNDGIQALVYNTTNAEYDHSSSQPPPPAPLGRQLQVLELVGNSLTSPSGHTLQSMLLLQSPALIQLDISGNHLGDEGCVAFLQRAGCCELTSLNLMGNGIGALGGTALGVALARSDCQDHHDHHHSSEKDDDTAAWVGMVTGCSLHELNLGHNQLGDNGCIALAKGLQTNTCLRILNLSRNEIGNPGVIGLSQALQRHPHLQSVALERNVIGDKGAVALVAACSNIDNNNNCNSNERMQGAGTFEERRQSTSSTTSTSATATTHRPHWRRSRRLNLQHNRIGTRGVQHILKILRTTYDSGLEHLNIHLNAPIKGQALTEIRFWTTLNRLGRRFLVVLLNDKVDSSARHCHYGKDGISSDDSDLYCDDSSSQNVVCFCPMGLWPHLLAKARHHPEILHYFLCQKPGLCVTVC